METLDEMERYYKDMLVTLEHQMCFVISELLAIDELRRDK